MDSRSNQKPQAFDLTVSPATNVADIETKTKEYDKKLTEMHQKEMDFLRQNPGASIKSSSTFTLMSVSLFNREENIEDQLKKLLEQVDDAKDKVKDQRF